MSFIPKVHEIYKHFKGNLYQIVAVAEHTETGERLVVYQALYDDSRTYASPLSMYTGRVDKKKYPDAGQEFRFELQGPCAARQKAESVPTADMVDAGESAGAADAVKTQERIVETGDSKQVSLDSSAYQKLSDPDAGGDGEELSIDPLVMEFLDADSYGQRLNILAALHHRITDDMITTMAIACDIEVNDGDIEERYEALKTCLLTLERYECNRLR